MTEDPVCRYLTFGSEGEEMVLSSVPDPELVTYLGRRLGEEGTVRRLGPSAVGWR